MGRADQRDPGDPAMTAMLPRLLGPIRDLAGQLASDPDRASRLTIALCAALSGYVFMVIDGNLDPDAGTAGSPPGHLALLDILLDGGC
jgi:hypothetical protein